MVLREKPHKSKLLNCYAFLKEKSYRRYQYTLRILREISDYHHVAIMLSPQSMSIERFFDRDDIEKQFLLQQIQLAEDPEKTMANFKDCLARINSKESYDKFLNSGFFTIIREDTFTDTRFETMNKLAEHFQLDK